MDALQWSLVWLTRKTRTAYAAALWGELQWSLVWLTRKTGALVDPAVPQVMLQWSLVWLTRKTQSDTLRIDTA